MTRNEEGWKTRCFRAKRLMYNLVVRTQNNSDFGD